jgi:tetraprenyl-beta-curcumene synthase
MTAAVSDGMAMLATAAAYRAGALPTARREMTSWRHAADRVPDLSLRHAALSSLTDKASNIEATAVLATLAPRQTRRAVTRASTALQIAIDFLDSLGERAGAEPLEDGLQLHRSLGAALTLGAVPIDWYLHHPHREDGGYLDCLVAACQECSSALPSQEEILPVARHAAERCGEGQSHTHAAHVTEGGLETWAREQRAPADFSWWEVAAGASSSVAAHALIALAGDQAATAAEAEAVDAVYFPAIGALTVLLDDLVDREADEANGEHNYLDYYPNSSVAGERLAAIAAIARTGAERLRSRRHAAILAGVVAYYLSSPRVDATLPRPAQRQLLAAAGPGTRLLATVLRRGSDD